MINLETAKTHIISKILDSSFEDGINIFLKNVVLLQDVNFIVPNPYKDSQSYIEDFKLLNLGNLDVNYFFQEDKLFFYNADYFLNQANGRDVPLTIEKNISLDTQITSYLYRKFNKQINSIPKDIDEFSKLVRKRKWGVDSFAYFYENILFNREFLSNQTYKDSIYAFESCFYKRREARERATKLIDMQQEMLNSDMVNYYQRQYLSYYLSLLVMADIVLNNKGLTLLQKEEKYAEVFHYKVGLISEREANLAKLFFVYGTKVSFFGKIQKGNKNIIKDIKNMAWDVFHINNTIHNICIQSNKMIDFTMPYFITYDRRLKEILPIYKINSAAFVKGTFDKYIHYQTDLIDPIIKNKYFVLKSFSERMEKIKDKNEKDMLEHLNSLVIYYEGKLG